MKGDHRCVLKPYNHTGRPCRPKIAKNPAGVLNPEIKEKE